MSNGYIYILTNPSFSPDLLKIGTTTRTPEERANELYEEHAGIPTKFVVAYKKQTTNCQLTKEIVHRRLNDHRPDQYKDFFKLPFQQATIVIDQVVKEIDELYHSRKVKSKQLEIVPFRPPDLSTPVDMSWFYKKGKDGKEEAKTTKIPDKDTELIQESFNRYFSQAPGSNQSSGSDSFASIAKKKGATKDKAGAEWLQRKAEERAKSRPEYLKKKPEKKAVEDAKEKTNIEKKSAYDSRDTIENKLHKNISKTSLWSWKTLIIAFIISFFLNIFISAATGTKPRKNIIWTVIWIYQSIEAWKYWRWKALLPYPMYLLVNYLLIVIVAAIPGTEELFWVYIIVMGTCNIGGLAIFYQLLQNSRKTSYSLMGTDQN